MISMARNDDYAIVVGIACCHDPDPGDLAIAKETRKNNFATPDVARTLVSAAPRLISAFWGFLVRGSTRVSTRQAGVPAPRRLRSKCEVILACTLSAVYLPAHRASRVLPMAALRQE